AGAERERAVRERREPGLVAAVGARLGVDALAVQAQVDRVGAGLTAVQAGPDRTEAVVVLAPAERARAVAGGERRGLVDEEELGELARLHHRAALPALELEPAGDPAAHRPAAADGPPVVVQASAVAVDEPARGRRDQLPERRDAVPEGHQAIRPAMPT